ncbi:hypothetical protein JOM56_012658 [Amanita muscaria]
MGDRDLERRRHGLTEVEGDLERRRCRLAEVTTCLSKMSQTIEPREKAKRTKHGDAYFENERAGDGKKEHDRRSTVKKSVRTKKKKKRNRELNVTGSDGNKYLLNSRKLVRKRGRAAKLVTAIVFLASFTVLTGEERQSYFAEKRQESRQVVSILDINQ